MMKLSSAPSKHGESVEPKEDAPDKGKVRIFVYGSLKRGHQNNGLLKRHGADFVGLDTITGPFRMHSFGGFPGVVYDDRVVGANTIYGEVWAVDEQGLCAIDWLEGYPRFYNRTKFRTDIGDKKVWMYHLPYEPYARTLGAVPQGIWAPTERELGDWKREHRIDLTSV